MPSWRRRDWLAAAGLAAVPLSALTQPAGGASLPAAQSLPDELARAIQNRQPLIVMASLEGCVFCRQARQSQIKAQAEAHMRLIDIERLVGEEQ